MFTGLVESKGTLVHKTSRGVDTRLSIRGVLAGNDALSLGESIAVDGVCLTVARIVEAGGSNAPSIFEADVSAETLERTTLGELVAGGAVNLERALPIGARLGGHIVSGHVDGVGRIVDKTPVGAAVKVVFEAPTELMRFIAEKGSICVSGVSLTVNGVDEHRFDVVLVPHTRDKTSLDALPTGAPVNLEVDLLARYVARLLAAERDGAHHKDEHLAWLDRLRRAGYM